jgi:hypothetical protein
VQDDAGTKDAFFGRSHLEVSGHGMEFRGPARLARDSPSCDLFSATHEGEQGCVAERFKRRLLRRRHQAVQREGK